MNRADVLVRAGGLASEGIPFALATVVAVQRPASARRGDRGLITAEGELFGWIGGACSEPIVVREALRALADGESRLVRIGPPGRAAEGADPDTVVAESSCASEGVVEVLVEPQLPEPLLAVVGDGPAAETLARLAPEVGWRVARELSPDADAVVVATMGHGDDDVLASALELGTGYVGLVASGDGRLRCSRPCARRAWTRTRSRGYVVPPASTSAPPRSPRSRSRSSQSSSRGATTAASSRARRRSPSTRCAGWRS
jgi:xanthine/CO dehydrogenase XdhC/CoxF family maturation factor